MAEPTLDDLTEKEILLEIYNELKAIRRFIMWPVWIFLGVVVLSFVGVLAGR